MLELQAPTTRGIFEHHTLLLYYRLTYKTVSRRFQKSLQAKVTGVNTEPSVHLGGSGVLIRADLSGNVHEVFDQPSEGPCQKARAETNAGDVAERNCGFWLVALVL